MRCRNIQDELGSGQREINSEASPFGFQQLGELFAVVSLSSLVQCSRADGRNAFHVAGFGVERDTEHEVSRDHVLTGKIEDQQLYVIAQSSSLWLRKRPDSCGGDRRARQELSHGASCR